jgi:hypothetical protein
MHQFLLGYGSVGFHQCQMDYPKGEFDCAWDIDGSHSHHRRPIWSVLDVRLNGQGLCMMQMWGASLAQGVPPPACQVDTVPQRYWRERMVFLSSSIHVDLPLGVPQPMIDPQYEIPKWDGDLHQPNAHISASRTLMERKEKLLYDHFGTDLHGFGAPARRGMPRARGIC